MYGSPTEVQKALVAHVKRGFMQDTDFSRELPRRTNALNYKDKLGTVKDNYSPTEQCKSSLRSMTHGKTKVHLLMAHGF